MRHFTRGGIHPPENKLTSSEPIIDMELPLKVYIPLSQHIGAPATAVVAKGDEVVTGQLIGEATGFMSANIHSTITGKVTQVAPMANGQGLNVMTVVIERTNDTAEQWVEGVDLSDTLVENIDDLEADEILSRIKTAGIVGMGGATFPTHVKLSIPPNKKAEVLIINGAECEPYLTSDHRSLLSRGAEFLMGCKVLLKQLGVKRCLIGIESNKPDAIEQLTKLSAGDSSLVVVPLKVGYPQGGEKQLIEAVTGREVPPPPGLPIDVGAVVVNVSTTLAVYDAVLKGRPLIDRVVTVSGKSVSKPINVRTRFGTPISSIIALAGGLPEDCGKVVNGGPMMGRAMVNLEAPVAKGCSGITIIADAEARRNESSNCIKCGRCVAACPMALEPYLLSRLMQVEAMDRLEEGYVTDCIECGSCQYSCPAQLPLLDYIRLGKQRVMGIIRARSMAK